MAPFGSCANHSCSGLIKKIGLAFLRPNFEKTDCCKIYENYEHFREFSFSAKKDNAVFCLRRTKGKAQTVKNTFKRGNWKRGNQVFRISAKISSGFFGEKLYQPFVGLQQNMSKFLVFSPCSCTFVPSKECMTKLHIYNSAAYLCFAQLDKISKCLASYVDTHNIVFISSLLEFLWRQTI